jgi:hypothetical protein
VTDPSPRESTHTLDYAQPLGPTKQSSATWSLACSVSAALIALTHFGSHHLATLWRSHDLYLLGGLLAWASVPLAVCGAILGASSWSRAGASSKVAASFTAVLARALLTVIFLAWYGHQG